MSSLIDVSTIVHGAISSGFDALQRDTYSKRRGALKKRCIDANQSGHPLNLLLLFVVV